MTEPKFTPGPWDAAGRCVWALSDDGTKNIFYCLIQGCGPGSATEAELKANTRLIAAAPRLYGGCAALLGLVELILHRSDISPELRKELTTNHRIREAKAALATARGEP